MTLCTAWIRDIDEHEELVFATDSCLSGDGVWESGVKLFGLSRQDLMICFAGSTARAYPLILQFENQLKHSPFFLDDKKDITELVEHIIKLFTGLVLKIINEYSNFSIHSLRGDAQFLFGGWSWKESRFIVYKLLYKDSLNKFTFEECIGSDIKCVFIGDYVDIADSLLKECLEECFEDSSKLDMEPLKVLCEISLNNLYREVAGAPQIGKVYKNQKSEYFGIMWKHSLGSPHFLGKQYDFFDKPDHRYYDPETFDIWSEDLPYFKPQFDNEQYKGDYHVEICYRNGTLRDDLSEKERTILLNIIKHNLYQQFLENNKTGRQIFSFDADFEYKANSNEEDYDDLYEN